jgi:polyketide synthase 12
MGLFLDGVGPVSVTDARLLARIPAGWSYAAAATVPIVFLTAYLGLVDLAGLRTGQSVLVHAGTGGVGMAAVQLAAHLGAEVYATASPPKQGVLRGMGVAPERIASSRTAEFAEQFPQVDVVLNSLAGELADASLGLVSPGGRFLELGKTDIRDPREVAAAYPGVEYQAYDLADPGPDRLQEIFAALGELFAAGALRPLPVTAFDIRHAPDALRQLSLARHIGKVVLTFPAPLDPEGTVLITGGTGTLGGLTARHLVARHGARHLLLASRSGPAAAGADQLRAELAELGARVDIAACDTADPEALRVMLEQVPAEHPLTAVVHTAAVLADATVAAMTPEQLDDVLRAKAEAAWHLHELTKDRDLAVFAMFSSIAGALGAAGQANYAAANAFLDALAARRSAEGLAATSLAWGYWEQASGLTGHLDEADRQRLRRQGIAPLPTEHGLALLDEALASPHSCPAPVQLDLTALRESDATPPLVLRDLVQARNRRRAANPSSSAGNGAAGSGLADRLAGLTEPQRHEHVRDRVLDNLAAVLGHADASVLDPSHPFKELGIDSLTAVELRNRLSGAFGLRLASTIAFDHPTPDALTRHVLTQLAPPDVESIAPARTILTELDKLEAALSALAADDAEVPTVAAKLNALLRRLTGQRGTEVSLGIESATDEELFAALDDELDTPNN